jgi:protein-tyrosine phosphatase
VRILFVCMGNICRSPSAEAVLRELARREFPQLALEVDSAGTHGYHVGEPPDARSIEAGRRRGYELGALRARRVTSEDFRRFRLLLAMDGDNHARLLALAPAGLEHRARLFLGFDPHAGRPDVPDPYYGGPEDFELVLDLVERAGRALLRRIAAGALDEGADI